VFALYVFLTAGIGAPGMYFKQPGIRWGPNWTRDDNLALLGYKSLLRLHPGKNVSRVPILAKEVMR